MLKYDRIDVSGGYQNKWFTRVYYFHFWHFFEISFTFQPEVCNGYQDWMQKTISFNNVTIILLKEIIIDFVFGIKVKLKP